MSRRFTSTILTLAVTFATLLTPQVAIADEPPEPCPAMDLDIQVVAAPAGLVAVQDIYVNEDCELVVEDVEFVAPADLPAGPEGMDAAVFGQESAVAMDRGGRSGGGASTQASHYGGGGGTGCCWKAYSVQRSWDCCNLLMNEYWMELQYNRCSNICSSYIRTYNAVHGGKWKSPYWARSTTDQYLTRTGGGLNYTWVTFEGHQGYSYRGPFDWTGTYFYNSYTTQIRGNATGGWVCDMSFYWRTVFAGWHEQIWCGTGFYGEK